LVTALGILFTGLKDVFKRAAILGIASIPKQLTDIAGAASKTVNRIVVSEKISRTSALIAMVGLILRTIKIPTLNSAVVPVVDDSVNQAMLSADC